MTPRAWSLIRPASHYRADAFMAGLTAAGFTVSNRAPEKNIKHGDVLVIWNRYGEHERIAGMFEDAGGRVLVAENGYLAQGGGSPKYMDSDNRYYAIAIHDHNGAGVWRSVDSGRFRDLSVRLRAWRQGGGHILVCPSRGIASRHMRPPAGWTDSTVREIKARTDRAVRVRKHPGNHAPAVPLEDDLLNAWACVIWSSSVGVHALLAGVPVIACAPKWILKDIAGTLDDVNAPPMRERATAFERLASAQWSLKEIANGDPFRHLLSDPA